MLFRSVAREALRAVTLRAVTNTLAPDVVPISELDRAIALLEAAPQLIETLRAALAWKRLRGPDLYSMPSDEYEALHALALTLPAHLEDPRIAALMEKLG